MKHGIISAVKSSLLACLLLFAITLPLTPSFGHLNDVDVYSNPTFMGGAYVVFAGKTGGEIRKTELMAQTEVHVDGCAKDYKIVSYTLEITSGQSKSTYQSNSNQLTKEMKTKLQSLAKGDVFEFKLMKAQQASDKHTVDVHGNKFTVV